MAKRAKDAEGAEAERRRKGQLTGREIFAEEVREPIAGLRHAFLPDAMAAAALQACHQSGAEVLDPACCMLQVTRCSSRDGKSTGATSHTLHCRASWQGTTWRQATWRRTSCRPTMTSRHPLSRHLKPNKPGAELDMRSCRASWRRTIWEQARRTSGRPTTTRTSKTPRTWATLRAWRPRRPAARLGPAAPRKQVSVWHSSYTACQPGGCYLQLKQGRSCQQRATGTSCPSSCTRVPGLSQGP